VSHNNFSSALSLFFFNEYTFLLFIIFYILILPFHPYSFVALASIHYSYSGLLFHISHQSIVIFYLYLSFLLYFLPLCASCQKIPDVINIPALLGMYWWIGYQIQYFVSVVSTVWKIICSPWPFLLFTVLDQIFYVCSNLNLHLHLYTSTEGWSVSSMHQYMINLINSHLIW